MKTVWGNSVRVCGRGKRFSETAFIQADALPLSEMFARSYTAFPQDNGSRVH